MERDAGCRCAGEPKTLKARKLEHRSGRAR